MHAINHWSTEWCGLKSNLHLTWFQVMTCNSLYSLYLTVLHVVINVVSDTQHPCHQATEVLSYGGRHTWDSAPWDEPWTMQSCSPLVGRGESLSLNPDQNETQQKWVHNLYKYWLFSYHNISNRHILILYNQLMILI